MSKTDTMTAYAKAAEELERAKQKHAELREQVLAEVGPGNGAEDADGQKWVVTNPMTKVIDEARLAELGQGHLLTDKAQAEAEAKEAATKAKAIEAAALALAGKSVPKESGYQIRRVK